MAFRKELQRYETVELQVLRFVNDAHSAAADLLDDSVVGDNTVWNQPLRRTGMLLGNCLCGDIESRRFDEAFGCWFVIKERFDFPAQRFIARADLVEKSCAVLIP